MKLLFSTLIAAVMAASVQAFTVAWSLQNSQYNIDNWAMKTDDAAPTIRVIAFFAAAEDGDAMTAADAAKHANDNITVSGDTVTTTNGVTFAKRDLTYYNTPGVQLQVTASNLNTAGKAGYYYMVIFESNELGSENYAVAKTAWIADSKNATEQGIYNTEAGVTVPSANEFIELNWDATSKWGAPLQTPEPTALALLALGVAGLALRRKNA